MTRHMSSVGNTCGTACGQYADGDYIVRGSAASRVVDCEACIAKASPGAPVAHIYAAGNASRTACGKADTFDSVWSLAWAGNEGRITCDTCRRVVGPALGDGRWAADVAERLLKAQRDGYERQMQAMIKEDQRKQAERIRGGAHDFLITDDVKDGLTDEDMQHALRRWGERRLASIDARIPRPTHLYSPSAPTDALCGGCEYGHLITADVHEATCAQCLRVYADAVPMVDIARRRGDWYTLPAGLDTREQGRGIVDVPGVPQRFAVAVGYDDPTGDDIAADVGPRR